MQEINHKEADQHRVCRKCLLQEMNEAEYKEKLEKYIIGLDVDTRADDVLYKKRLNICKACDKLSEGTCLVCGCYVELRAATKIGKCPSKKW